VIFHRARKGKEGRKKKKRKNSNFVTKREERINVNPKER